MNLSENGAQPEPAIDTPEGGEQSESNEIPESRVRATVFLSYSHADKDTEWYQDVIEYLSQLSVSKDIEFWDDTQINPGEDWESSIEARLDTAKAAVFLVTPTFLTSDFITSEEVPKLLERQELDGLFMHALIAKPCDWQDQDHPLSEFLRSHQLPHSPERSLEEMDGPERRRMLNDLVKHMRNELGVYRLRSGQKRRDAHMEQIERSLGVELIREAAGGQNSLVYQARKGQLNLAVKAVVARAFSDTGQAELSQEFTKCLDLHNPVFLRLYEIAFPNGFCAVTTDWMQGRTLARTIGSANRRGYELRRKLWGRTTNIVLNLAGALSETHSKGLRYINLNPEKIFISDRSSHARLYPIDF